jgi:predicted transcriptional regulator
MSHINYSIIKNLLKSPNHIRGLAKDLNTNQTTIARKIKDLSNNNVVDFNIEGKNKTYFLKKTLEAKEYIIITEHYELLKTIKKYPILRNIIEEIKKDKTIEIVILYGSYAKLPLTISKKA